MLPRRRVEHRCRSGPAGGEIAFGICRDRAVGAGIMPHPRARRVEYIECHRPARRLAQPIIDHRAIGRILADRRLGRQRRVLVVVEPHPHRARRREQRHRLAKRVGPKLAQQRQVAEHPDRAALRRDHQIVALDQQVARPRGRQILLQWLPVVAIVEADEYSALGPRVEQPRALRVGAYRTHHLPRRKPARRRRPALPAIMRAQHMRREIVEPLPVDRDISRVRVALRQVDRADLAPFGHRHCKLRPMPAAVAGDIDQPGISPDPHSRGVDRRRLERGDRAITAGLGVGHRDIPAAAHSARSLAGQIAADFAPMVAAIGRFPHQFACRIKRCRTASRRHQRHHPIIMMAHLGRSLAIGRDRIGRDVGHLPGAGIPPRRMPAKPRPVDDVGVDRIGNVIIALVPANRVPVAEIGRSIIAPAGDPDRAAVLLPRVDPVGKAIVGGEVIQLSGRLVVPVAPRLAAIDADRRALVRCRCHAQRVGRVEPQMMIIVAARATAGDGAGRPAMVAAADRLADRIHRLGVARVGDDPAGIITGERLLFIGVHPMRPAVVGSPHPAVVLGVDHRIQFERVAAARGGDADPPQRPARPAAAREFPPADPAIVGSIDCAARPRSLGEIALPRPLPPLPRRRKDGVRMLGIARQIDRPGPRPGAERVRPILAAVGRAIDAARLARAEEMPHRRDQQCVGIARIDPDPPDIFGVRKPEVGPCLAAVGGAIHPAPRLHVIAWLGLPAADIHRVGP